MAVVDLATAYLQTRFIAQTRRGGRPAEQPLNPGKATRDLLALNIDLASVMQAGRWKTNRTPMRYGKHVLAARSAMARAAERLRRD
jgi:hypothetical protein